MIGTPLRLLCISFAALVAQSWISQLQLAILMIYWMLLVKRVEQARVLEWKWFIWIYLVFIAFFDIIGGDRNLVRVDVLSYAIARVFIGKLNTKRAHQAMLLLIGYNFVNCIYYALPLRAPPSVAALLNETTAPDDLWY